MSGEPIVRGDQDPVVCPPPRTREAIGAFSVLLAIVEAGTLVALSSACLMVAILPARRRPC